MSFSQLKEIIGDNEEAINIITELEANSTKNTDRINFLEKESKSAFEKRDSATGELRRAKELLGLDEFTEDTVAKLKKKPDDNAEVLNLQKQLEELASSRSALEQEFNKYKNDTAMEMAFTQVGIEAQASSAGTLSLLKTLLQQGATVLADGSIGYANEDGTTLYVDGKPMTLQDKMAQIASNEEYAGLFKPRGKGGSDAGRSNGGTKVPNKDISTMSHAEKAALQKEIGSEEYLKLVAASMKK